MIAMVAADPGPVEVSVVVPAYCEHQRIAATVHALASSLDDMRVRWEIVVVDDGSDDGTADVVRDLERSRPGVRLVRYERNRGKGFAVRVGLLTARGRDVVFTDADLSTPPNAIAPALAALANADVVVGTRARPASRLVRRQARYREAMGKTFNLLARMLGLTRLPDTQCGFKALRGPVARRLAGELVTEGFAFDVELLARAARHGFVMVEQPVEWHNRPESHVRVVRDSLRMLCDLVRIAVRLHTEPPPQTFAEWQATTAAPAEPESAPSDQSPSDESGRSS